MKTLLFKFFKINIHVIVKVLIKTFFMCIIDHSHMVYKKVIKKLLSKV